MRAGFKSMYHGKGLHSIFSPANGVIANVLTLIIQHPDRTFPAKKLSRLWGTIFPVKYNIKRVPSINEDTRKSKIGFLFNNVHTQNNLSFTNTTEEASKIPSTLNGSYNSNRVIAVVIVSVYQRIIAKFSNVNSCHYSRMSPSARIFT